jgi:hypothetical protein
MEEIIKIKEASFRISPGHWQTYDGFAIYTDRQTIRIGISSERSCCENFGYFMSEDNFRDFEGSTLLDIEISDTQLRVVNGFDAENMYEGGVMFVNINTSEGLLQFVAYNEHNGYYGHDAVIISEQLTHSEHL